jgi:hypothetical protein
MLHSLARRRPFAGRFSAGAVRRQTGTTPDASTRTAGAEQHRPERERQRASFVTSVPPGGLPWQRVIATLLH